MIVTALCCQAKLDMMNGVHQPGDSYRIALYTKEADLNEETVRYNARHETMGPGYTKGGFFLTNRRAALVDKVACLTWNDVKEDHCTFKAAGALVYNESRNGAAIATVLFDAEKRPSNGVFELEFPLPIPTSAFIVIL